MISFSRTASVTLAILVGLTGCAGADVSPGNSVPPTPSGAPSTAAPPAPSPSGPDNSVPTGPAPSKPAGIPKTPTDLLPSPGWIEGTVTRGGTGPCYGLMTFDGVAYAMHSIEGIKLTEGEHIRAELTPAKLRISCGEGITVSLGDLQRFP